MIFKLLKKFVFSCFFIYSFDVLAVSFHFSIPINFVNILLVSFFGVPGMIGLILFSLAF